MILAQNQDFKAFDQFFHIFFYQIFVYKTYIFL